MSARTPDGTALGVLRVAPAGEWAGLSCLAVTPAARRRGTGRALTLAGLRAAVTHGAERAFLQVEVHNTPAQRLYRELGFVPVERYVYRER
nr:GNAT family N-acetyltransferase [Cellulomonas denverensis]